MNSVFLAKSNKNETGLRKKISINKYWKHTVDRNCLFVKTHRQEGWDLEGSTQLLTIHFVRMKMFAVCTFNNSFNSTVLVSFSLVSRKCFTKFTSSALYLIQSFFILFFIPKFSYLLFLFSVLIKAAFSIV